MSSLGFVLKIALPILLAFVFAYVDHVEWEAEQQAERSVQAVAR